MHPNLVVKKYSKHTRVREHRCGGKSLPSGMVKVSEERERDRWVFVINISRSLFLNTAVYLFCSDKWSFQSSLPHSYPPTLTKHTRVWALSQYLPCHELLRAYICSPPLGHRMDTAAPHTHLNNHGPPEAQHYKNIKHCFMSRPHFYYIYRPSSHRLALHATLAWQLLR